MRLTVKTWDYPDVAEVRLLPEQFFAPTDRWQCGAVRLMGAMLEQAADELLEGAGAAGRRKRRRAREAAEWIFAAEQDYLFSFDHCCLSCGVNPDHLRDGIRRWAVALLEGHTGERPFAHKRGRGPHVGRAGQEGDVR